MQLWAGWLLKILRDVKSTPSLSHFSFLKQTFQEKTEFYKSFEC